MFAIHRPNLKEFRVLGLGLQTLGSRLRSRDLGLRFRAQGLGLQTLGWGFIGSSFFFTAPFSNPPIQAGKRLRAGVLHLLFSLGLRIRDWEGA